MKTKKVVILTENEITPQTLVDLQARVLNLTVAIQALTVQQGARVNDHVHEEVIVDGNNFDDNNNPFAELRQIRNNRGVVNESDKEEDEDNRWKLSFKLENLEIYGSTIIEELFDLLR